MSAEESGRLTPLGAPSAPSEEVFVTPPPAALLEEGQQLHLPADEEEEEARPLVSCCLLNPPQLGPVNRVCPVKYPHFLHRIKRVLAIEANSICRRSYRC